MVSVDDFLAHYAEGYDPVKAHLYYLENRKLKGGSATASLSNPNRSSGGPHSAVRNVRTNTDVNVTKGATPQQQARELQRRVAATKARIEAKLSEYLAQSEERLQARIDRLPKNANPERIASLVKMQKETNQRVRKAANEEMKSLGENLKSVIGEIRQAYEKQQAEKNAQRTSTAQRTQPGVTASLTRGGSR